MKVCLYTLPDSKCSVILVIITGETDIAKLKILNIEYC